MFMMDKWSSFSESDLLTWLLTDTSFPRTTAFNPRSFALPESWPQAMETTAGLSQMPMLQVTPNTSLGTPSRRSNA